MARPGAQEVAGFYAFPRHLLPALARLVRVEAAGTPRTDDIVHRTDDIVALDPCGGEGEAIAALARQLAPDAAANLRARIIACELEAERAATLRARLVGTLPRVVATVLHADAFTLVPAARTSPGAHLLYLNPPYGLDRAHGRLEHRWLDRFTPLLLPGEGILLFVVPHYALAASAAYIAQQYDEIACYRLPAPDFARFRQVVLVGRRTTAAVSVLRAATPTAYAARLAAWAVDPGTLPTLGEAVGVPLAVHPRTGGGLTLEVAAFDLTGLLAAVRPWQVGDGERRAPLADVGVDKGLRDMIGQPHAVAAPPKPAHLALALASGCFNGRRIVPNDRADGLPDLLLKGVFTREYKTVAENTNKEGEVTSEVQIQQPKLEVTCLDLSTNTFVAVKAGSAPTGARSLPDMTMADIMASYGESLAALMEAQFPALHNPLDERHQIALPTLGRSFYSVQQQAVQVGIKLLAQGANPFVISEVGTGKTTMALAMAAALSPQYVDGTMGELARVGIASDRLRPISHVVVMCPPHLLETWQDELRAVLPGARAVAVERFADLDQAPRAAGSAPGAGMTFYILSRERAKLGSGLRAGVWLLSGERRCPTCGGAVEAADTTLVSGRARCKQLDARPTNGAAEVARDLAALLAPLYPLNDTVAALAQGRIQVRARARLADRLAAAARERGDPDTPLRHAEQLWGSPERRFWRARLLRRLAAEAAALIDKSHEHERTTHTLDALVTLAAALPDAERAPLAEEGRRGATMEAPADLLPDVAAHLYAATAADTTVYGNGARVRRTVCELLLLWDGPETPLERAHRDDADDAWSTFRRVRARLSRERAAATGRRSTHGPDASEMVGRWSDYTVDEEGRLQLGDLPVGAPETAAAALDRLMRVAQFAHDEPCGEFLYQATPAPRRYPLARHLVRRRRGLVDLVILDEVQELGHAGTAQEKAGHRLVQLPGAAVISLSGSIMNGYASTLFPNYWALSARFRRDYARDEKQRFIDRFGYRKRLVLRGDGHQPVATVAAYGAMSDREELIEDPAVRQLGEAPGLLPLFVLRYLLPEAVLVHKSELDLELPPFLERPVYVTFSESAADTALRGGYTGLKDRLVAQVQEDRGTGLAGKLWGALSEMPSYLDLGTADTGNCRVAGTPRYRACYPRDCGGSVVHEAPLISSLALTPKERWLVATLRAELAEGRNVLVFVRHTKGSGLPKRLQRLIVRELGEPAAFLDADKVGTDRRQAWISSETVATGRRVLIVNPNAIKTGLNNLVFASTAIWLELDHSAITYRQANGRLHRIGQMNEVRIYYPVYQDTAQEIARDLLAAKVTASLQADGLELRSTLEALGASGEEDATTLAMSIGQGIYQRLTRGYVPDRLSRRADAVVAPARRAFVVPPLPPLPLLQPRTLPPGGAASVPIADAPEGLILTPLPVRALPVLDLGSVEPLPPGRDAERPAHCALQRLPEVPHDRQLSFLDLFADGDEARPAS